jgi:uncharacterized protein (TIGR02246 family)
MMDRTDNTDIALIYELYKNYAAEWSPGGDFERWMDMWIAGGIQLPPDAPRNMGKEQIRAGNQPGFDTTDWEMTVYPDDVQVFGDRAYSHGTYEFAFTPKGGGKTTAGTGKFLTILDKQANGAWKIAIDCFNFDAPLE